MRRHRRPWQQYAARLVALQAVADRGFLIYDHSDVPLGHYALTRADGTLTISPPLPTILDAMT